MYILAAKYIFGGEEISKMVSALGKTTKNSVKIFQDPQKLENAISMVRVVAPLTSAQTVTKVNTYLPLLEKLSTFIGMYGFLNRAQNFRPIEALSGKNTVEKMTQMMKTGNVPVSKLIAQPLLNNNMEKIMGTMAMNMMKNGNFNDILSSMLNQYTPNNSNNDNKNIDINSLIETFMPLINSMNSNSSATKDTDNNEYDNYDEVEYNYSDDNSIEDDNNELHKSHDKENNNSHINPMYNNETKSSSNSTMPNKNNNEASKINQNKKASHETINNQPIRIRQRRKKQP